ncbi:uncharacterized protein PS065_012816 [Dugong dugon]
MFSSSILSAYLSWFLSPREYLKAEAKPPKEGVSVFQGRGCELHLGGVAAAGPCPEDLVQRCDAGELQPPGHSGVSSHQTSCDLQVGTGGGTMDGGGRDPWVELLSRSSAS